MNTNNAVSVALSSCDDYSLPKMRNAVIRVCSFFGGMQHFIQPGQKVLIKPNMLTIASPEKATTTHPSIVAVLAELVKEAGGIVSYGDSPGIYSPNAVARVAGFSVLGIPMADFKNTFDISFPEGKFCKTFTLAQAIKEADVIINVPKLKTHGQMMMTGAVKNMFGCVPGLHKAQFHFKMQDTRHFAAMLLDLYQCVKPALSIVDAVVAMEGNGPNGGTPRQLGFIAASTNAIALDTVCAEIIGLSCTDVPCLYAARQYQWEGTYLEHIALAGDQIALFKVNDFKIPQKYHSMNFNVPIPHSLLKRLFTPKPVIHKKPCKKCYECITICPAQPKALSADSNTVPVFNYHHCIRCFCCQEICPHKAIRIKPGLLSYFIR